MEDENQVNTFIKLFKNKVMMYKKKYKLENIIRTKLNKQFVLKTALKLKNEEKLQKKGKIPPKEFVFTLSKGDDCFFELLKLGRLVESDYMKWHNSEYIYPIGYKARRVYIPYDNEQKGKFDVSKDKFDENKDKLDENRNMLDENKDKLDENRNMLDENKDKLDENRNMLDENKVISDKHKGKMEYICEIKKEGKFITSEDGKVWCGPNLWSDFSKCFSVLEFRNIEHFFGLNYKPIIHKIEKLGDLSNFTEYILYEERRNKGN